jgi:hypothetical protein
VAKTLRNAMGLRDSFGDIKIGDTVRIVASGHVGRVEIIGPHGLFVISGVHGVYAHWEVEKVLEKEKTA